jgi:hypothetical protein
MLNRHTVRGNVMQQIEAFTATGMVSGAVADLPGQHDALDPVEALEVDRAVWYPISGGAAERRGQVRIDSDDLLVICPESANLPIHASWHYVELRLGPFRVSGELPTLPGFDPGRALARPGGTFLLLRDVRVELVGHPESGRVERPNGLVNRYAVDDVASNIELGFFFPGARYLGATGHPAA